YGRDRRDYYDRYDRDRFDRYDRDRTKGRDRDGGDKRSTDKSDPSEEKDKLDEKELQAIRKCYHFAELLPLHVFGILLVDAFLHLVFDVVIQLLSVVLP
ncbi:9510_t:CDS:2, partial [Cetraspora pellucida]